MVPFGTDRREELLPTALVDLSARAPAKYEMTLLRRGVDELAVIRTEGDDARQRIDAAVRDGVERHAGGRAWYEAGASGPRGITQRVVPVGSATAVLILSRTSVTDPISIADAAANGQSPPGYEVLSRQQPAQLPGIGSLPVSFGSMGYAVSYTSRDAKGDQRAVAVGVVCLERSFQPLELYRWWYEGSIDASRVFREEHVSEAGVGETRTLAVEESPSMIVVLASYGLTSAETEAAWRDRRPLTPGEQAAFVAVTTP